MKVLKANVAGFLKHNKLVRLLLAYILTQAR
jgi:hypothetical protein